MDQLYFSEDNPKKYRGPLPRVIKVIYQLATGLSYIHSMRFVHRDIKPANVLISCSTNLSVAMKWADFGLCKEVSENETFEMSATRGTLTWMAPEILACFKEGAKTNKTGSTKSDVFSAGCLFFKIVTKVHPFGNNPATENPPNIGKGAQVNFLDESKSNAHLNHRAYYVI